jgi:hypothetical protein
MPWEIVSFRHNWGPELHDNNFQAPWLKHHIENEFYWPILKYPALRKWVKHKADAILANRSIYPEIFLKESGNWTRDDWVIYVNFWPKEAKLRILSNWWYELIEVA